MRERPVVAARSSWSGGSTRWNQRPLRNLNATSRSRNARGVRMALVFLMLGSSRSWRAIPAPFEAPLFVAESVAAQQSGVAS